MNMRQAMLLCGWSCVSLSAWAQSLTTGQIAGLQVGLDRQGFSPGVIDGKAGSQTRAALAAWRISQNQPAASEADAGVVAQLVPREGWAAPYTVTTNDLAQLGRAPQDWLERSTVLSMAFETLREALAERFHCKESFLGVLNPAITNWTTLAAGAVVIVPNTSVTNAPPLAARLQVDLAGKFIRAFDADDRLLAHFPCSIAAQKEKRPVGVLTVQAVAPDPNYTYDPVNFPELDEAQRGYGKLIIPPGPNNPVGTAWISLSLPGYGMHGTPHPELIGKTESHGCFRLANWNAERLLRMVEVGTPVEVVGE